MPALPAAAMKLVKLVHDPDHDVREIVQALQYDPACTSAVLRLCNSAAMGMSREATSLMQAVVLLGNRRLAALVVTAQFRGYLVAEQDGYDLRIGGLRRHAIGTALAAESLTEKVGFQERGTLFAAALLHDIGKLALDRFVGEAYEDIDRKVREENLSFSEAEERILDADHAEVGAMLAEHWGLSETIVRAIRMHHRPDELDPPDPIVDLIHVADNLCLMLGMGGGLGADGLNYRFCHAVRDRVPLTLPELELELAGTEVVIKVKEIEH